MIKIERTQPEPQGLAAQRECGRTYNIKSVREQLWRDFYGKCYICGASVESGSDIEHLRPHHGANDEIGKQRKYDWDNLFLSCPNCNKIKNRGEFEENIIDCCREDPEKQVRQEVGHGRIQVKPRKNASDPLQAAATAKLIDACFNFKADSQAAENCRRKRWELKCMAIDLCKKLRHYRALRDDSKTRCSSSDLARAREAVEDMIDPQSEYAAFMRTIVRDRLDMFREFEDIVGTDPDKEVCNG